MNGRKKRKLITLKFIIAFKSYAASFPVVSFSTKPLDALTPGPRGH